MQLRNFSSYVVLNPTWPNGTNSSAIIKQAVYTINNILESYAAKDLLVLCCSLPYMTEWDEFVGNYKTGCVHYK